MADYIFNIDGAGCTNQRIGKYPMETCGGKITDISISGAWDGTSINIDESDTTYGYIVLSVPSNDSVTDGRSQDVTITFKNDGTETSVTATLCQTNNGSEPPEPPTPLDKMLTLVTTSGNLYADCNEGGKVNISNATITALTEDKSSIRSAIINGDCVDEISWHTFTGCTNLTSVTITEGVEIVGGFGCQSDNAYSCISLTGVSIPDSTTIIGSGAASAHAFKGCSALTECTFGENSNLETIALSSFEDCISLTGITIPSTVQRIGSSAFEACTHFIECTFKPNSSLTTIGNEAFRWARFTSIEIPSSVTSIGEYCFSDCPNLETVVLPPNITALNEGVFNLCSGITSIDIPDAVTSIGNVAFCDCFGLTSLTIGTGITSIGWQSFRNARSLTSITIKAVTPPTLDRIAFSGMANCPIYVPSGSVEAYKTADVWSNYASRIQAIP